MVRRAEKLVEVRDLRIRLRNPDPAGRRRLVDGVSFSLEAGERLAIAGESGAGKSLTVMSMLGLAGRSLDASISGDARFLGRDLMSLGQGQRRELFRRDVGVIFQDPMGSFDPLMKVGRQLMEPLLGHRNRIGRRRATHIALEALESVGIEDPNLRFGQYPHELSGGLLQRCAVASAVVRRPKVIVADEPTTALDATLRTRILDLLVEVTRTLNCGLIIISHDLGIVSARSDRLLIMYLGAVMEYGASKEVLQQAWHPYTRGLINSIPLSSRGEGRLKQLPGEPGEPQSEWAGCRFRERCPTGMDQELCAQTQPSLSARDYSTMSSNQLVACHFARPATIVPKELQPDEAWDPTLAKECNAVAVEGFGITKHFRVRRRQLGPAKRELVALDRVDFRIFNGQTLAVVGESGSGKSTLGRIVSGGLPASSGTILYEGEHNKGRKWLASRIQMVHQDTLGALDPRRTIGNSIGERLLVTRGVDSKQAYRALVSEVMDQVALRRGLINAYPHELSGGQRQRVCIARALICEPTTIILDEPVSALDVTIQAQILNLLTDLQRHRKVSYLLITHDLNVARYMADDAIVIRHGMVVEAGSAERVFDAPEETYTKSLMKDGANSGDLFEWRAAHDFD